MTEAELAQGHYDHQDELDASEGELVDDAVVAEDLAVNRPGDPA